MTILHETALSSGKKYILFKLNEINLFLTVITASSGIESICMFCFSTTLASYETCINEINTQTQFSSQTKIGRI
jgi:hypothetical protein